jgi:hypothetical protein
MCTEHEPIIGEDHLRNVSATDHHLGPPLAETWLRTWWPWLVLAAGVMIIVLGGILFTATS